MTRFVRIQDGIVREVYDGPSLFPMTRELEATWREAPAGAVEGWVLEGETLKAPPPPSPPVVMPGLVDRIIDKLVERGVLTPQDKADLERRETRVPAPAKK